MKKIAILLHVKVPIVIAPKSGAHRGRNICEPERPQGACVLIIKCEHNMPDDFEERIRMKAHELWIEDGRPEGRADVHWEKAPTLVAIEDDRTSLKPVTSAPSEPLEVQDNLGEFPSQ